MTKGTLKGLDFILLPPEYFAAYASDKKYGPMSKETLLKESRSCMGIFFFFCSSISLCADVVESGIFLTFLSGAFRKVDGDEEDGRDF
jgi:hypothetical protein